MNRLVRGGLAGLVATGAMTPVIAGGWALRLLRTPPPAQITANVARQVGVPPARSRPAFHLAGLAAHLGYGAACGVGYGLIRPRLPRPAPPAVAGLAYGGAVWAASYLGLLPALGLYPWPAADRHTRLAVMVAAHAVYGVTLAATEAALRGRGD